MGVLNRELLDRLEKYFQDRYSQKFANFGIDARTLGWDKITSQWTRFAMAYECLNWQGKKVLDIGCGLGDFYGFLREKHSLQLDSYYGFDINPELINACRSRFPDTFFEVRNILLDPPQKQWDIVVLFGLLNLKLEEIDNLVYARQMIEAAFDLCQEALVVDMLSTCAEPTYEKEDMVYYYNPSTMLALTLDITPHVILRHDYASIPQREFMLVMKKKSKKSMPNIDHV